MENRENTYVIRPYRPEDRDEWMRVHAIIMTLSHAWNYVLQERPEYEGYESTRLVVEQDGKIIGLTDTQYENEPGELCFLKDSRGGYVLELGRLPEWAGLGLGKKMIDATIEDAKRKGIHRLEFWTQDRNAQRYYRRLKMKEISRHYRFHMKAPTETVSAFAAENVGIEHIYGVCSPEDWPEVKRRYEIITQHPLEPHLCVGFEIRF